MAGGASAGFVVCGVGEFYTLGKYLAIPAIRIQHIAIIVGFQPINQHSPDSLAPLYVKAIYFVFFGSVHLPTGLTGP